MALSNTYFNHNTIRNSIIAFGSLFNELTIQRKDADNNEIQSIAVPLYYGGKSKALAIVNAKPDLEQRSFKLALPALSFQISGFTHNSTRRTYPTDKITSSANNSNDKTSYVNNSAPYDMGITLTLVGKNAEDVHQVFEQILPYFNPSRSLKIKYVPEIGVIKDLHINLTNIDYNDDYEGEIGLNNNNRTIVITMSFNLNLEFFGPIIESNVIKTVNATLSSTSGIANVNTEITPSNASQTDNWGFITQYEESQ